MMMMSECDMDHIDIYQQIGSGSSAEVYCGKHRKHNVSVAIKIMKKDTSSERGLKRIARARNEGAVMASLNGLPNVCNIFGQIETKKYVCLVMELCRGGDLFDKLNNGGAMSEDEARKHFVQLAATVAELHRRGIVHRDIKPENIFFDKHGNLKLGDFGFARTYDPMSKIEEFVGTLHYACPQIIGQVPYVGPEVDVWACGAVLLAMLTARVPFSGGKDSAVISKIKNGDFQAPVHASREALDLLHCMLEPKASKRITMAQVLRHPWLRLHDELQV